jgi:hypothetical protein
MMGTAQMRFCPPYGLHIGMLLGRHSRKRCHQFLSPFNGSGFAMSDSASLKINQATKHIASLNKLFSEQRPFSYIIKTDTNTRERTLFAKKNEAVADCAALICGDAIHNLRTALDHVYWEIVSPVANTDSERRNIQFPFNRTEAQLRIAITQGIAQRVSPVFCQALVDLKPHGEPGGNELLYLLHEVDILDKHKLLIPTADYKKLSTNILRPQIPDFPGGFRGTIFGGNSGYDLQWQYMQVPENLGTPVAPSTHIFERELNVPVDIVFAVRMEGDLRPMVPTLNKLVDVVRAAIHSMRNR